MKRLLYIPNGEYIRFHYTNCDCEFEDFFIHCNKRKNGKKYKTHEDMLNSICEGDWSFEFYERAKINEEEPILRSEFEIIEE